MPSRAKHPCAHPGCPRLVPVGERFCADHASDGVRHDVERRGTAAERGYGKEWQAIRDEYIKHNPHCARCGKPAQVVHHILPKRDGGSDDPINLQSLCNLCHAQVHAAMAKTKRPQRGRVY